jgi:hypothetical protein
MTARWPVRVIALAGLTITTLAVTAPPASAHTVSGVPATNYRTTLLGISPPTPGLSVRLLDLGRRIQLTNHTRSDVVVLGYQGEPYLRLGPAGVFANLNAPDYYSNQPVPAGATSTTLPPRANPNAAPDWVRTSGGRSVIWRDRRTRWEGPRPAQVAAAPSQSHLVVPLWSIQLRQDDRPVLIEGQISWVPGPRAWPWLIGSLVLAGIVIVAGMRWRAGPVVTAAAGIVVPVSVVHAYAAAQVSGGSTMAIAARALAANFYSVPAWVLGVVAAARFGRASDDSAGDSGVLLAGVCGVWLALIDGALDIPVLGRSQVPTGLPAGAARAATTIILGLGVGMAVVAALLERRRYGPRAKQTLGGARPASRPDPS